jgi:hypothetical protein
MFSFAGRTTLARSSPPESTSAERRAFEHYLRTGRRLPSPAPERKFNPYHDPRNGRFTFAPGGPQSLQNAVFSDRRGLWKPKEQPNDTAITARPPETRELAQGESASSQSDVRASSSGAVPSAEAEPALAKIQTDDLTIYLPVDPRDDGALLRISATDDGAQYPNCPVGGDCRETVSVSPKNSDEIQLILNRYRMSIRDYGWKDNDLSNLVDIRYALYTLMEREAIAAHIEDWDPTRVVPGEWIAENAIDFDRDDPAGPTRAFAYLMTLAIDGPGPPPELFTLDALMDPQQAALDQAEWQAKNAIHQSYQAMIGPDPIFDYTVSVAVSGASAKERGDSYEVQVRRLYGGDERPPSFTLLLDGKVITGQADHVAWPEDTSTAIEAKYTDSWMGTLRNPLSVIGIMPWSEKEQQRMIEQARRYSIAYDGGAIYHTNSFELARFYSKAFKGAGISKFKFVITPIE